MRFANFEGPEKERPEPPKVIRAVSLSVAVRKKAFVSGFPSISISDSKCAIHRVAQGPGPHRPETDLQNQKRYHSVSCDLLLFEKRNKNTKNTTFQETA